MIGQTNVVEWKPKYENHWQWPPVYNLGYNFLENQIYDNGTMYVYGYEVSSGHEGFVIKLIDLVPNQVYVFSMNFTHNCVWHGEYRVGVRITNSQTDATVTSSNYTNWTNNLKQLGGPHSLSITFTANSNVMYMGFCGNGYADSGNNYFTFTDMKIVPQK